MQQAVDALQLLAQQNGIMLTITPCRWQVWCDADRIVQTLINLVSNAIKFSLSGTTVWIEAKGVEKAKDRRQEESTHQFTDSPAHILFSVADQGRGIPADKLESIFGRFQQVDASDSRNKGGTGLGLAICQQIIELHGGKIWVESRLGHGSTFYFTIPLP
jgi:signal transduction histidine kinase